MSDNPTAFKERLGARIRELREAARISQSQLASKIGWGSHTTVVDVENGRREVKAWELSALAREFHVEMTSLLTGSTTSPQPYILWRERPKAGAEDMERMFLRRSRNYGYLESILSTRPTTIESLPRVPFDIDHADYPWAYEVAASMGKSLDLGRYPSASLVQVLENGFGVRFLVVPMDHGGSAACFMEETRASILINDGDVGRRQVFSIAHELFHLITWGRESIPRIDANPALRKKNEQLANAFAAGLLMPAEELKSELNAVIEADGRLSYASMVSLAQLFGVSTVALVWRLVNLKQITKESADRVLGDPAFKATDFSERRRTDGRQTQAGMRYVRLAYQAYERGKISRSRLSELIGVSLIDLDDYLEEQDLLPELTDHALQVDYS